jgi:hypothetical protein
MTAKAISILTDPHPCGHIVYPYTDENLVADAVGVFASSGLNKREAVILIATEAHCERCARRLEAEGFDLERLETTGQFACIRAEQLLERIMVDGMPDETRFRAIVGEIIDRARNSSGKPSAVRMFGEMVSLLWPINTAAAERLESLWNDMIEARSVSLLCTYTLDGNTRSEVPPAIMALHGSHIG